MKIENLLKKHSLRNTNIRRDVLQLFLDAPHALSHNFIEEQLQEQFDRVTIYRTLKTFEDSGLIHRILNDTGAVAFALCRDYCEHHHEHQRDHQHQKHSDKHVHFKCDKCQLTFCLEQTTIPIITLPPHYQAQSYQVLVIGVCDKCSFIPN